MYNKALALIRKGEKPNFQSLRNQLVPKKIIKKEKEWLNDVPNCVKAGGVRQLAEAYKTNFAKKKKDILKVQEQET